MLITPNGNHGLVTGETAALVIDLRLNLAVLEHDPHSGGTVPWCDGVARGSLMRRSLANMLRPWPPLSSNTAT